MNNRASISLIGLLIATSPAIALVTIQNNGYVPVTVDQFLYANCLPQNTPTINVVAVVQAGATNSIQFAGAFGLNGVMVPNSRGPRNESWQAARFGTTNITDLLGEAWYLSYTNAGGTACEADVGGFGGTAFAGTFTLPANGVTSDTNRCGLDAMTCGGNIPCSGMAGYSFNALLAALHIQDTPILYAPPVGNAISFTLAYNQLDNSQPTNVAFCNLGPQWSFSAVSFILDDPASVNTNVLCYLAGGGAEQYIGLDTNTWTYATQPASMTVLQRTSSTSYVRTFLTGARSVYGFSDGKATAPRRIYMTSETDPSGNTVQYNYEQLGNGTVRLTSVQDAIGQVSTIAYDNGDPLKITRITDPFGHTAGIAYTSTNGALRLTSISDPAQNVSSFQYDVTGFLCALTTPYGTTAFATTGSATNQAIRAIDPLGQIEEMQFRVYSDQITADSAVPSGVSANTSSYGANNTYFWSKKEFQLGSKDVTKAEVTHWAYQDPLLQGFPLWTKRPLENRVWYNYPGQTNSIGGGITNQQPSAIARVLPDGTTQKIAIVYDSFGNATNVVDALGRTTQFAYSTNGVDLLQVQQKVGTNSFDVLGAFTYNAQHLPTFVAVAGVTNWLGYTTNGLLSKTTNALGYVTAYNYGVTGYLTNVSGSQAGDSLDIAYDSAGQIQSLTDGEGYTLAFSYDALGQITNRVFPDGSSVLSVYSALSPVLMKGRDNRWNYRAYDANQKLTDVQDPSGRIFHYEWCGCGALDSITDPKGQITVWNRDLESRPTQKLYADYSSDILAYETNGSRLKQTTDAAGKSVSIVYNKDDTLQQVSYSGGPTAPSVSFAWDTNYNRIARMVDGIGTNLLSYVPAGQPGAGNIQSIDGPLPNDTITFGYDPLGRPLSVQIGTATSAVQYDQLGRVWWSSNLLGVTTIQYADATGRPALVNRPNGLFTSFSYTPVSDGSRLHTMQTTNAAGQVVEQYDYNYDIRDLILTQTCTIGTNVTAWSYNYDLAQQLTGAMSVCSDGTVHKYSYAYDKAGNRLSEQIDTTAATESPNNANQITSRSGGGAVRVSGYLNETGTVAIAGVPAMMTATTNFTGMLNVGIGTNTFAVSATDLSGNAATNWYNLTVTANGQPTSFTYDLAGNLLSKSSASQTLSFAWDGADRCTAITNGVYRTVLAYDGLSRWARITEYSNTTTTADRRFVYNGTSIAEERDSTGTNVIQRFFGNGFWRTGTNYYYLTDHLGSVREVTLANGTVVARFEYDPYGRRTQTFGTLWVDFGFAGLFELPNGLKLAVWRVYDPSTGRWNSRDPIREQGGWNLYAYCEDDPVNKADPMGESGTITIYASGPGTSSFFMSFGLNTGHAWIGYTPDGGELHTFATFGNNPAGKGDGLFRDLELGYMKRHKKYAQRSIHLNDADEQKVFQKMLQYKKQGAKAWRLNHPCTSFAQDVWEAGTGEQLDIGKLHIPGTLAESINNANQNGYRPPTIHLTIPTGATFINSINTPSLNITIQ